jgi:hypothetical protein
MDIKLVRLASDLQRAGETGLKQTAGKRANSARLGRTADRRGYYKSGHFGQPAIEALPYAEKAG